MYLTLTILGRVGMDCRLRLTHFELDRVRFQELSKCYNLVTQHDINRDKF